MKPWIYLSGVDNSTHSNRDLSGLLDLLSFPLSISSPYVPPVLQTIHPSSCLMDSGPHREVPETLELPPCDSDLIVSSWPCPVNTLGKWKHALTQSCTVMLAAALFLIAKSWKQTKCPSVEKWVNSPWYTHAVESYTAIKGHKILICTTARMNFQICDAEWKKRQE